MCINTMNVYKVSWWVIKIFLKLLHLIPEAHENTYRILIWIIRCTKIIISNSLPQSALPVHKFCLLMIWFLIVIINAIINEMPIPNSQHISYRIRASNVFFKSDFWRSNPLGLFFCHAHFFQFPLFNFHTYLLWLPASGLPYLLLPPLSILGILYHTFFY